MIAIIKFKNVPGKRYELRPRADDICGVRPVSDDSNLCDFYLNGKVMKGGCIDAGRWDICKCAQVYFKEVK